MNNARAFLDKLSEYETEKYATEELLGKELFEMVEEEYGGNIITFINREVVFKGYEDIGWTIRNLYENYEDYVRAFGEFIDEKTEESQKQRPSSAK